MNVCAINALVLLLFLLSTPADAGLLFISFDFPGAIDTQATAITPTGDIVGRYTSADGVQHGFLRSGGTFKTIDFPGSTFTDVTWINPVGQIVGDYNGTDNKTHGFLLSGQQFTSIDYPGAQTTIAAGIAPKGDIVGGKLIHPEICMVFCCGMDVSV